MTTVTAPEMEDLFPSVPGAMADRLAADLLIRGWAYERANSGTQHDLWLSPLLDRNSTESYSCSGLRGALMGELATLGNL